jgi:hypothetical protein
VGFTAAGTPGNVSGVFESDVPRIPLPSETLVKEKGGGHILWFDGLLLLPVGTRIHLDNRPGRPDQPQVPLDPERFPSGRANAIVTGVRISDTQSSNRCLVLDVELMSADGPEDE